MSDAAVNALIMALVLLLPLSALAARRVPLSTTLKYAGAWIAIFAIGFLIVAQFT